MSRGKIRPRGRASAAVQQRRPPGATGSSGELRRRRTLALAVVVIVASACSTAAPHAGRPEMPGAATASPRSPAEGSPRPHAGSATPTETGEGPETPEPTTRGVAFPTGSAPAQQTAEAILSRIPFRITDKSYFPPSFFDDAPQPVWVTDEDLPLEQLEAPSRHRLVEYAAEESPDDPDAQAAMLAVFDDPDIVAKVPDPRLRVGLATFSGTFLEPFIEELARGKHPDGHDVLSHGIRFGPWPPHLEHVPVPTWGGMLYANRDTGEEYILLNQSFRFEDPVSHARIIAFEIAHFHEMMGTVEEGEPTNGTYEEAVGAYFSGLIRTHQLAYHPYLAGDPEAPSKTVGQVLWNAEAALIINSGSILREHDRPIIPDGALPWTSWWDRFNDDDDRVSQAPYALGDVIARLGEPGAELHPADVYDRSLIEWLDDNQAFLTADELLAAARALQLDTGDRG